MKTKTLEGRVVNYIKAACPCLFVPSTDDGRVLAGVGKAASDAGFRLFTWKETSGVYDHAAGQYMAEANHDPELGAFEPEPSDPISMLDELDRLPEKSVLLAFDFHLHLGTAQQPPVPMLVRRMKDALERCKNSHRRLVICGAEYWLPPELEKQVVVCELEHPSREDLAACVRAIERDAMEDVGDVDLVQGRMEDIVDSLMGLSLPAAEDALALAYVESGKTLLDPEILNREKCAAVKKTGLLEVVDSSIELDDIGGLDALKHDLKLKRRCFSEAAEKYGLPSPDPLLIVGHPGTGKSLTAQATRLAMGKPLVRIEAGSLYGSLVGETEANWRKAFSTVKALGKSICWVDEVDGLFAGSQGGSTDGGTSQRLTKAILQDLQLNREGILFVFTANDIDHLPDPLVDRCDVWSVDLPSEEERKEIWRIHIAKRNRKPNEYDIASFAKSTKGFSGRQIEQAWVKSMMVAFNDNEREPGDMDVAMVLTDFVPTSVLMKDVIDRRRKRLSGKARPASTPKDEGASVRKF